MGTICIGLAALGFSLWRAPAAPWTARTVVGDAAESFETGTVQVQRGEASAMVSLSGPMVPVREMDVVSRLAGELTSTPFVVGDRVRRGEIVATVFSAELGRRVSDLESRIEQARKDVEANAALVEQAENRWAHNRAAYERDLIARRDFEETATALETARARAELGRANLAQHEAMLAQARALLRLAAMEAPMDGVVTRNPKKLGAMIAESEPVLTLGDTRKLKVAGLVSEACSGQIRVGMKAEVVRLDSGRTAPAHVARAVSSPRAKEPATEIEIHVDNADGTLQPGTQATASVALGRCEAP